MLAVGSLRQHVGRGNRQAGRHIDCAALRSQRVRLPHGLCVCVCVFLPAACWCCGLHARVCTHKGA